MKTIVDYIQQDQRTFKESCFTPLDSLVFSTLAYCNFECSSLVEICSSEHVLLHDVMALSDHGVLTSGSWLEDSDLTPAFYQAVMASRRLRDVHIAFFVHETSDAVEKQFSALSFFLPDETIYCAFRGTDGSFAGWKEDFNLCFKDVIPSQVAALRYVSGIASSSTFPLILGGHSKGGNLAEYAALCAEECIYSRIITVYNHDGPSFLDSPSPRIDQESFQAKLHKSVPATSIIGLFLEQRPEYGIVESNALPVFSHSPFTWAIEGNDFVYEDQLKKSTAIFDKTLNDWLQNVSSDQRERFIDTMYELFISTNASSWSEFQTNLFKNMGRMLFQGNRLDSDTKKLVLHTFSQAFLVFKNATTQNLLPSPNEKIPLRKERYRSKKANSFPSP
ncbi:MAG: Mbeg1-like protein [Raoultibacter sp.]